MNKYLKVEGNSSLVRDVETMAIINTNRTDYDNYMRKREAMESSKELVERHSQEITSIKEELSEIKQMIYALLQDRTKG